MSFIDDVLNPKLRTVALEPPTKVEAGKSLPQALKEARKGSHLTKRAVDYRTYQREYMREYRKRKAANVDG